MRLVAMELTKLTTGKQMERKRLHDIIWANGSNDSMPCIISTCTPGAHVCLSSQDIDQLSFALITPLRTKDDGDYKHQTFESSVLYTRAKCETYRS
jgi:hypothetical protein